MRNLFRLSILLLAAYALQPAAAATVMQRDDARRCYLATMSELPALDIRQGLIDCSRAIADVDRAPDLRAGLLANRSDLKLKVQDFEGAVADADASITLDPGLGTAYLNKGAGLIGLHRYLEALAVLEKAIVLDKGERLQIAYFNRGLARDYLGDLKNAYFDYKKATELDPNFEPAKVQLNRFTVTTLPR